MDKRDLPGGSNGSQPLPDALVSIAARLLHVRSFENGDPDDEVIRLAAVELRRIADTLTTPVSQWPFEKGLD